MLQKHFEILSTCIKVPYAFKDFVFSLYMSGRVVRVLLLFKDTCIPKCDDVR